MKKLLVIVLVAFGLSHYALADTLDAGVTSMDASVAVGSGSGSAVAVVLVVPPALPDPIDHPADAYNAGKSDVATYGILWGSAAIVLGILVSLKKRNDADHWIQNKYAVAGLTAVPLVITALLLWKFGGGGATGLLGSVVAALGLLYQAGKPVAA